MLKKLLSVILVVSVLLSMICVSAEDAAATGNENSIKLLEYLGIVYPKNEFEYESEVSRADFAVYAARALGIDDTIKPGDTRYYIDMAMYDYAAYSVNCLVEKGILSVPENRMFRPAEPISFNEAVKIAVCMLGYKPVADTKGGYPNGYINTALQLDLISRATGSSGKFTLNDAISVLHNALITPVYSVSMATQKNGDIILGYRASEDDTLIYQSYGYKFAEGVLTGFNGMNIAYDVAAPENYAVIGGIAYKVAESVDLIDLIGSNICVLIDEDKGIIYAYNQPKKEDIISIDINDFESYNGNTLIYGDGTRTVKEDVSYATVLYNGAAPASGITDLFTKLESGTIKIIDYNGDSQNDAIVVEDYHAFVLKSANIQRNIVYSKISGQESIDLSSYDTVIITDAKGNALELSEIEADSVLNVMAATDKSRIEIIVSGDAVSGTVEKTLGGTPYKVQIDGTVYSVNKAHSSIQSDIKIRQTATFLLNIFGEIVMVTDDIRENYQTGFLSGINLESGLDKKLQFRVYTKNGGLTVFDVASKVRIDGIRYSDSALAVNNIPDAQCSGTEILSFTSQMILFKVNASGEISDVDTYYVSSSENPDSTLARMEEANGTQYVYKYEGRLNKKYPINNDTDFYCVPLENDLASDTGNYKVVKQGTFNRAEQFKFECYKTKGKNEFVDVVLYHMNPNDAELNAWLNSNVFLVDSILQSSDADLNTYNTITGLLLGSEREIDVYENDLLESSAAIADLDEGDLIRYRTSQSGKIIEIEKLYDAEDNEKIGWLGSSTFDTAYNSNFQLSYGYVHEKGDKTVSWGYESGDVIDEMMDLSSVTCMYYDKNNRDGNRLYVDKMDSITDWESAGDEGDIIIVQMLQTMVRAVIIYKR